MQILCNSVSPCFGPQVGHAATVQRAAEEKAQAAAAAQKKGKHNHSRQKGSRHKQHRHPPKKGAAGAATGAHSVSPRLTRSASTAVMMRLVHTRLQPRECSEVWRSCCSPRAFSGGLCARTCARFSCASHTVSLLRTQHILTVFEHWS